MPDENNYNEKSSKFSSGVKNFDSINPKVSVTTGQKPPVQVNLLNLKQKTAPKKILKKVLLAIILIIVILSGAVVIRAANLSQKIFVGQKTTFFQKIVDFIRGGGDNDVLIGESLGQVNILLLGIGGPEHDGPYLTDTMILAQIRPDIGQITLTAIPRDYLVNLPNNLGQEKINAAFALGIGKNFDWDKAGSWARQVTGDISGLQVPYFAVMDFSGFEKAIDQINGVDIQIDRTFTDFTYPDSGTGYLAPITFTAGFEHMNGTRALQFARSRHGTNDEGSDFARSSRQQKIIEAFKQKILSANLIKDAGSINKLLDIFVSHFHTNMTPGAINRVYSLLKNKDVATLSLSLDPETGLICPEILESNGAYVLTPCPGKSEEDVKNFFKNSFSIGKLNSEKSIVWLANSTGDAQIYNTAYRKLTNTGLRVYELNYSQDNLPDAIVYQANPKPSTSEFIKNELKAREVTLPPPGVTVSKDKVDVIVVLGLSSPKEAAPKPYIAPPARIPTTTTSTIDAIISAPAPKPATTTGSSTKSSAKKK